MASSFANKCLNLSNRLFSGIPSVSGCLPILPSSADYHCYIPLFGGDIPREGPVANLDSWLSRYVVSCDPREELSAVLQDEPTFCVIVCSPCARLRSTSPIGAGRVSMLCTTIWVPAADGPKLIHLHASLIGMAVDTSQPGMPISICPPVPPAGSRRASTMANIADKDAKPTDVQTSQDGTSQEPEASFQRVDDMPAAAAVAAGIASTATPNLNTMLRDTEGDIYYVDARQLLFVEADRNYTWVHGVHKCVRVRGSITELLQWKLPPFFVRVHRSFAINALEVVGMQGGNFELSDGSLVPVSERRRTAMRDEVMRLRQEYLALARTNGGPSNAV